MKQDIDELKKAYFRAGMHFIGMVDFGILSVIVGFIFRHWIYFVLIAIAGFHWYLFYMETQKIKQIEEKLKHS